MQLRVFIQNEANSNRKNIHDEKTLEYKKMIIVSREYPYPYGFILNTTSGDGDNLDCYVLTRQTLKTGQIVECEPVDLMEQIEDGKEDHNILAVLTGEDAEVTGEVKTTLTDFVLHVFDHIAGKAINVGNFLGRDAAINLIQKCRDKRDFQ